MLPPETLMEMAAPWGYLEFSEMMEVEVGIRVSSGTCGSIVMWRKMMGDVEDRG
jgi:hypothetical protein